MIVAQLSDLHIRPPGAPLAFGRIDTTAMARRAFDRVLRLDPRPDALIITGDLADCGRIEEYEILRDWIAALPFPAHLVLGNHDIRASFRSVFGGDQQLPFVQFAADYHDLRILGLDTLSEGEGEGVLCRRRLDWLRLRLAERPDVPTILALHHAPFEIGNALYDAVRLKVGADELKSIATANAQIIRILAGHHHRGMDCLWGGTLVSIAPAVVNALDFELGPAAAMRAIAEPAAFRLHVRHGAAEWVSHHLYVEQFGAPFEALPDPDYPAMTSYVRDIASAAARR